MGRKPIPTHLRVIAGNRGKRPINENEPKPRRERPSAPAGVSDMAREVWGQVCLILDEMGVLTSADSVAVEMLCEAVSDHRSAVEQINLAKKKAKEDADNKIDSDWSSCGHYYWTKSREGGRMLRPHPAVSMKSDADRRIKAWCSEFGMTPSARSRLVVGVGGGQDKEKANSYFAS